jgi:hypothetical protein
MRHIHLFANWVIERRISFTENMQCNLTNLRNIIAKIFIDPEGYYTSLIKLNNFEYLEIQLDLFVESSD